MSAGRRGIDRTAASRAMRRDRRTGARGGGRGEGRGGETKEIEAMGIIWQQNNGGVTTFFVLKYYYLYREGISRVSCIWRTEAIQTFTCNISCSM